MGPLVTTEWLAAELGKPGLVVFDATKYLPNEPKDGHAEFVRAHIPGARYFDIDQISEWLAAELGKPGLVVFDATKYLPNEPKDGHAEFVRAHIPGARYFDIDQ